MSNFVTMQVRNAHYSALIEGFTSTTYAMIITSDPMIQPATILINIEASRSHFESLIANVSRLYSIATVLAPLSFRGCSAHRDLAGIISYVQMSASANMCSGTGERFAADSAPQESGVGGMANSQLQGSVMAQ